MVANRKIEPKSSKLSPAEKAIVAHANAFTKACIDVEEGRGTLWESCRTHLAFGTLVEAKAVWKATRGNLLTKYGDYYKPASVQVYVSRIFKLLENGYGTDDKPIPEDAGEANEVYKSLPGKRKRAPNASKDGEAGSATTDYADALGTISGAFGDAAPVVKSLFGHLATVYMADSTAALALVQRLNREAEEAAEAVAGTEAADADDAAEPNNSQPETQAA